MRKSEKPFIPQHIAIVMDGNGRWAQAKGLPRNYGHRRGAENMRHIIEECLLLGVKYLTLFAFSTENWKRPAAEVNYLMGLPARFYERERHLLHEHKIKTIVIGDMDSLPATTRKILLQMQAETQEYSALTLFLAFNYGGRAEILMAAKKLANKLDAVTEADFTKALFTQGCPDPDLLIRCGREMRLSNFLLWQSAYAELYFPPKMWPEFSRQDLREAVAEFTRRNRRFGRLTGGPQAPGKEDD